MTLDAEQQFIADLQREDDIGLILRGHLHIEHQLIELLSTAMPFADRCDWGVVPYRAKVELAYGHGMPKDLKDLLLRLGTLRNQFAHKLDAAVTPQAPLAIYNSLSARLRGGLNDSYKVMGGVALVKPSSLPPRDLLTLIVLTARQATKAAAIALRAG